MTVGIDLPTTGTIVLRSTATTVAPAARRSTGTTVVGTVPPTTATIAAPAGRRSTAMIAVEAVRTVIVISRVGSTVRVPMGSASRSTAM
ncbi:hypothetical protein ACLQ2R_14715, partial [Streptosporangium sp. DT93]|uniref:hypothetical protein n=1 Tax=Streptosporangium sp. DT93 TaxID=3393428 RepID=UPI003CE87E01